jgi:hypothetical protein
MNIRKIMAAFALTLVAAIPAMAKDKGKHSDHGSRHEERRSDDRRTGRFAGLDSNGDGVITRGEWRGNDTSFQQIDRNKDGVLAGDEIRRGKHDKRTDRDRRFDTNGDGVINRGEWRGDDASFRNRDRNGDGVLSGDELRRGERGKRH